MYVRIQPNNQSIMAFHCDNFKTATYRETKLFCTARPNRQFGLDSSSRSCAAVHTSLYLLVSTKNCQFLEFVWAANFSDPISWQWGQEVVDLASDARVQAFHQREKRDLLGLKTLDDELGFNERNDRHMNL